MLVDPEVVHLATLVLQDVHKDVPRELDAEELEQLRVSLAEAIQAAIVDWYDTLPLLFEPQQLQLPESK